MVANAWWRHAARLSLVDWPGRGSSGGLQAYMVACDASQPSHGGGMMSNAAPPPLPPKPSAHRGVCTKHT